VSGFIRPLQPSIKQPEPKKVVKKVIVKKPVVKPEVVTVPKAKIGVAVEPISKPIALPKAKRQQEAGMPAQLSKKQLKKDRRDVRYLNRKAGVVTDAKTGLMWIACSIGQEWNGERCVGEAEEYLRPEGISLAKGLVYADYNDWRLPTRTELHSIVDCSHARLGFKLADDGNIQVKNGVPQNGKCLGKYQKPTIDLTVFPDTLPGLYWSYSYNARTNYSAWAISFGSGYQYNYNTSNLGLIRLVRKVK